MSDETPQDQPAKEQEAPKTKEELHAVNLRMFDALREIVGQSEVVVVIADGDARGLHVAMTPCPMPVITHLIEMAKYKLFGLLTARDVREIVRRELARPRIVGPDGQPR